MASTPAFRAASPPTTLASRCARSRRDAPGPSHLDPRPPLRAGIGDGRRGDLGPSQERRPSRDHAPRRDGAECFRLADRKSTRLNSSHVKISYAVFCLKKKKKNLVVSIVLKKKNMKHISV